MQWQTTLEKSVSYEGVGLHLGKKVRVTLEPALPDEGIVFVREDLPGSPSVKATVSNVVENERGTTLGKGDVKITTVEHILAALSGMGVDNVYVRMNCQELPAGDGSALPWVRLIESAGIVSQGVPKKFLEVKHPFWLREEDKQFIVLPDDKLRITYVVDFPNSPLKSQFAEFIIERKVFVEDIAPSRTFGFLEEVESLKKKGLIQGGSLENAVVIDEKGVMNPGGLRFPNEPVRHKILDLIGDLYLIGRPLKAHIIAIKAGHTFNVKLARKLEKMMDKDKSKKPEVFLDIKAIEKILPHRYPFLLVDKIICMKENEIVGVKNFTINEPFFQGHFPGHPVVPAALIIEAMAQVAGVYLLSTSENEGKLAYFAGIDKARFRKPVFPGDQLVTQVKVVGLKKTFGAPTGKVEAVGFVEGEKVAEAVFWFSLVER
ncbi:bifunctional UDP-3-O-[3-hydroxymyristoyl] N-acetylglucosamine deacetylase/3-hydroxyacyl-ACP dehydratase [Candidatus Aerophobetes bacterium]|nr:bifunctional UDP-3-O-[3-hydroxymyristoyl] N-acetylglucosamine deacetylase/3-hydroxyacyl-ACP dehydratase [Candidatus Aerophobetes bacterium]